MRLAAYPNCCGILILAGFGYDESCTTTKQFCEDYLRTQEKEASNQVAMLMVALNTVEQEKLGSVFKARNWTLLTDGWRNPRTMHGIYLWVWKCVGEQPIKKKTIKKSIISPTKVVRGSLLRSRLRKS